MYPLFLRFTIAGGILGFLIAVITQSPVLGLAIACIMVSAGALWLRDTPPAFPGSITYQWVFVVMGLLGRYISSEHGDEETSLPQIERAVALASVGFLCLTVGVRLGLFFPFRSHAKFCLAQTAATSQLSVKKLALLVALATLFRISLSSSGMGGHVFGCALGLVDGLFCLLWLIILQQKEGLAYGLLVTAISIVTKFGGKHSIFKELVFMLLVMLFSQWKPWIATPRQRRINFSILISTMTLFLSLIAAGVIWEGSGLKGAWRSIPDQGGLIANLTELGRQVQDHVAEMEFRTAAARLAARLDAIWQLAIIIERVPTAVPYERGALTMHAIKHIAMPRFLFPNKKELGSDSWLAETYLNLTVGDDTSVGIGYMAEFYVDYGFFGVLFGSFCLGVFLAFTFGMCLRWAPSPMVGQAFASALLINGFTSFESNLAKFLGGYGLAWGFTLIFLWLFGHRLLRLLQRSSSMSRGVVFPPQPDHDPSQRPATEAAQRKGSP